MPQAAQPPAAEPYGKKRFVDVKGRRMAVVDQGTGKAIVFQHGNPTSSYLWRNVMPHLEGLGRLVAADMIGMGGSDKLHPSGPHRYHYAEQRDYLFALWDALDLGDNVTLVLHDWGSVLGFDWANQHRDRIQGIAFMATRALADEFHSIEPQDARVLLFDGGSCVLGSFAPALTDKATKILQNLGVELHMGVHVTDVRHDGVTVTPKAGGPPEEFAARTVLWTAGVEAVPFARRIAKVLEAQSDHAGRIAVAADLSVPGHPEIFVIGDLVGRDNLPGVAENAMQGGIHAAACVRRDLAGKARPHYRYRDVGSAAYISRGHALLQAGPVKLSGFIGWLGWGVIHIAFLTGVENRISTVATCFATTSPERRVAITCSRPARCACRSVPPTMPRAFRDDTGRGSVQRRWSANRAPSRVPDHSGVGCPVPGSSPWCGR